MTKWHQWDAWHLRCWGLAIGDHQVQSGLLRFMGSIMCDTFSSMGWRVVFVVHVPSISEPPFTNKRTTMQLLRLRAAAQSKTAEEGQLPAGYERDLG